ncbi:MAG: hypothetical protein WD696_16910 [Bryobacteraceae bacterium]
MSLNVSPEVEARIVAKAQEAGVSVDDYLEQVVGENEEFGAKVRELEANTKALSREEIQGKLDRGVAQLERGDYVDGEQFMADLLAGIKDVKPKRRAG